MTRRRWLIAGAAALGVALAWVAFSPRAQDDPEHLVRAVELTLASPHLTADEVESALRASDDLAERLGDEEPEDAVRRAYADAVVTEAEIVAFYEANGELFRGRTLASSRFGAEKLLRVHATRRALDLPEPDHGLVWP